MDPLLCLPAEVMDAIVGYLDLPSVLDLLRCNRSYQTYLLVALYEKDSHTERRFAPPRRFPPRPPARCLSSVEVERARINQHGVLAEYAKEQYGIHWVCRRGFADSVSAALQAASRNPAYLHALDSQSRTPLFVASVCGNSDIVAALLRLGADPWLPALNDCTALDAAVVCGHANIVHAFVDGKCLSSRDRLDGWYGRLDRWCEPWHLLQFAAAEGDAALVQKLLDAGCDWRGHATTTPMSDERHYNRREPTRKELLRRLEGKTSFSTPLHMAIRNGHSDVVQVLLGSGPRRRDLDMLNESLCTPLALAVAHGHGDIVRMLVDTGETRPDFRAAASGESPIGMAARHNRTAIMQILLDSGRVGLKQELAFLDGVNTEAKAMMLRRADEESDHD